MCIKTKRRCYMFNSELLRLTIKGRFVKQQQRAISAFKHRILFWSIGRFDRPWIAYSHLSINSDTPLKAKCNATFPVCHIQVCIEQAQISEIKRCRNTERSAKQRIVYLLFYTVLTTATHPCTTNKSVKFFKQFSLEYQTSSTNNII